MNNEGVLEKKCNKHYIYFPDEDPWILCTDEYFYKTDKNKTDGLHPECKKCGRAKSIEWQKNNPEWYKELSYKKNRNPNPKTKETWKNHAQEQRDSGYRRQWELNNPEKTREYTQKRKSKNHRISEQEWRDCKAYFNNACAYCGLKIQDHFKKYRGILRPQDLHKEHVDDDGSNDLSNCIPSCNSCNSSKHTSTLEDWYNQNNPNFTQERLDKISIWLTQDHKKFIKVRR